MSQNNDYAMGMSANKLTLNDPEKNVLRHYGTKLYYVKNQLVFAAGDSSTHIYLIEEGCINIYRLSKNGRQVTVALRHAGEVVGLAEVLYGGDRLCFAEAMGNLTVMAVSSKDLRDIIATNADIALRFAEILGSRLREAHSTIHEMVCCQVPARIALMLIKLGNKSAASSQDGAQMNIKLTHEEIAHMVGTNRQTVTSVLNAFKQEGSIVYKGRDIDKVYPEKLVRWVI